MSLIKRTILIVFVICLMADFDLFAQNLREISWETVMNLESEAYELLEKEQLEGTVTVHMRRVKAFEEALYALTEYGFQQRFDPNSLAMLNIVFRLGLYSEYTERLDNALKFYRWCQEHPKLDSEDAQWLDSPLVLTLSGRLARIASRLNNYDARRSRIVLRTEKGQIRFPYPYVTPTREDSSGVLHIQSALRLAKASDYERAYSMAEMLLVESQMNFSSAKNENMLVFGIEGDSTLSEELIIHLGRLEKNFCKTFCKTDSSITPLIYVYANLSDTGDPYYEESIGIKLSEAVHDLKVEGIEGYFEALDNSIVLRKGLRFGGSWYLGTAAHELYHALIYNDFPRVPFWLDEGIASMFEEWSGDYPLDNYRLYFIRYALEKNKLPTVQYLIDPESPGWFDESRPLLAATARYFCIFIHAQSTENNDKLAELYKTLRDLNPEKLNKSNSLLVLEKQFGQSINEIENHFRQFILDRDLTLIDDKWTTLTMEIEHYINALSISNEE